MHNRDVFMIFFNMKVCCVLIKAILMTTHNIPLSIWGAIGWCDGAGYTSSVGASYNMDDSRARAYCAWSRCGWGLFRRFYSHLSFSLLFLPHFGRRPDIDWNTVSKGRQTQNNQPTTFNIKKKTPLSHSKSVAMGFFTKRPKNEFEAAVVNQPSVFEPLKF